MANNFVFNDSLPVAPLKLAALESCKDFAFRGGLSGYWREIDNSLFGSRSKNNRGVLWNSM